MLHTRHHLSPGAATVGQTRAEVPSGPSLTAVEQNKINKKISVALSPQANYTD
jgi:hypothetical protein